VGFLDALPHHLHDVAREYRVAPHEVIPDSHVPGERDAVYERRRGDRIIAAVERLGDAVYVAGNNEADDHLLAVRRHLHDLETAIEEHIKGCRGLPLLEDG
jgi:hypothetical protein